MESFKIVASLFIFFSAFLWSSEEGRILYLIQSGNKQAAFQQYQTFKTEKGKHDFNLLQKMALSLLEQGARSSKPEIQLLCLFGAGVSANEKTLPILEEAVENSNPFLQVLAINLLARFQNDRADDAIAKGMSSNYLPIRFEAAYQLAKRHYPLAYAQTEALMHKVDKKLLALIAKVLVLLKDPQAVKQLRKLLSDSNLLTRCETIRSCAEADRDELLPQIRLMASQHEVHQQEMCAYALGLFRDKNSEPALFRLASSQTIPVSLAAMKALYQLGHKEIARSVENLAKKEDLFAIVLLGEMEGSEPVLKELLKHPNPTIRLNASIALLEKRDGSGLPILKEIFIKDHRDLSIKTSYSPGDTLLFYRHLPNAQQIFEDDPLQKEASLDVELTLLEKTLELPEQQFLSLARELLDAQCNDLIPTLVELIEDIQTPTAIALLKKYQQMAGAPLIRNACNLALYRLKEPGPFEDQLLLWVKQQWQNELIRFRPMEKLDKQKSLQSFELTPQETSRLLIESLETLANNREDKAISVLIEAMQNGLPENSYILAGLLLNATQ